MDQSEFFLGKQENSNRDGFPAYVADRLSAVKWRDWKVHFIQQENMYDPPIKLPLPRIFNLLTDPKEERDVAAKHSWVADPVVKIVGEFVDLGDRVLARWCWNTRGQYSGIGGELRYSELVTYREGRTILIEHFRDHEQALRAVGLTE